MKLINMHIVFICLFILPGQINAQQNSPTKLSPVYTPPTQEGGWKITTEETQGAFSVEEIIIQPGTGSNSNTKRHNDKGFYLLEGQYEFQIDDHTISATVGSFLYVPVGLSYTYRNSGTIAARHLEYDVEIQEHKLDSMPNTTPVHIPPTYEDGELSKVGNNRKGGWKVAAKETQGVFSIIETLVKPGFGPAPHRHSLEDEGFYVLEGQEEYRIGDRVILASAGSFVFAPRGIPHAYKNAGPTTSRHITIISPAGFKGFLEERNALRKALSTTDPTYKSKLKALSDKSGLEYNAEWSFPP